MLLQTCLRHRGLNCTWTCLLTTEAWTFLGNWSHVAPGLVQTTGALCYIWTYLDNRSLCFIWTYLDFRSPCYIWTSLNYIQEPVLHLDVSRLQDLVIHLDVSRLQGPVLHLDVSRQQKPLLHLDASRLQEPTGSGSRQLSATPMWRIVDSLYHRCRV